MHFQRELSFNLEKNAIFCFVFESFLQILLINKFWIMRGYPNFLFGFQQHMLRSAFPAYS